MASSGINDGITSEVKSTLSDQCLSLSQPPYELHKAVFEGNTELVRSIAQQCPDCVKATDCHGNTPLHLSVMLAHKDITDQLLLLKPSVKEKNNLGWTSLNEAVSSGDRETICALLKRLHEELREGLVERRFQLIQALRNLDDFYAELKWEFHTWVPLLSRLLPNDLCRIYKTGCCIRLDSTLGDFTEMQWTRGDISFIYNGEDTRSSNTLSVVALDNQKKHFQNLSLASGEDLDVNIDDHVDSMMTRPIVYANMSTQPINVTRAQSGFFFFRGDRTETIGNYITDVYNINDLILISRKRREHLTPEQIKKWEEMSKRVETGDIEADELTKRNGDDEEVEHCPSLPPPPPCTLTWNEYLQSPTDERPLVGRKIDLRVERKTFKATAYMAETCEIQMKKLLDILEVITPYKHFHKLRNFVDSKLPPGFPVKIEFPVFPTVTAIITLQLYEAKTFQPAMFMIPRDYKKYNPEEETSADNDQDSRHSSNHSTATPSANT